MDDELRKMLVQIMEKQTEMQQDIKAIYSKLEGEVYDSAKALQDGYKQNYEMTSEIKELVKQNTEDIAELNISISGMKEDINFIASKTIRNDTKIDKINEKLKTAK